MSADELTRMSASDLAGVIRNGDVSPVEVTRAFLDRISRVDRHVHSIVTLTADRALEHAHEAERSVVRRAPLGPFHGVPVTIKDLSDTAGVRTTQCSQAFADNVPEQSNVGVERLFNAGAILLGKTNSPEFGLNATTEDGLFPATHNPWNLAHSAGGSSGGAAAALAARLCPLAQGSDGGGSIRIPASICGVVGVKPSRGRISTGPRFGERWSGFSTTGPMAHSVADVALALDVMSGPDVADPYPILNPPEGFHSAVGASTPPLKIAWTTRSAVGAVEPEVAGAVEDVVKVLGDIGHDLAEDAPNTTGMWELFNTIVRAHIGALPIPDPDLLGENARAVFDAGQNISLHEFLAARDAIYVATRRVLTWFSEFDLLVAPVVPRPGPRLGELLGTPTEIWEKLRLFIPFTYWVNMTGQPAVSLPTGMSSGGLPIGVQLVGRPLAERTLISIASAIEEALPWHDRWAPLD